MSQGPADPISGGADSAPRRRRPRYRGTHPRRFEERYKELRPRDYPGIHEHVRKQGRTPAGTHVPVLLIEVMDCLTPRRGEIVVDGTLGYAGHAVEFLKRIGPTGRLIGLDVDRDTMNVGAERLSEAFVELAKHGRTKADAKDRFEQVVTLCHSNFAGAGKVLQDQRLDGCDVLFADLGLSSLQIDAPWRGFSYKVDGPLDMRMDGRLRRTAADILATMKERQLSEALRDLADEPDHEAIARAIVGRRAVRPIVRTGELVALIVEAKGGAQQDRERRGTHPAARTFMALRMLVNDELGALRQLLRIAPYCLRPGGRIGVISFHSGEDRLVKRAFRDGLRGGVYAEICSEVITPTPRERRDNPRSAPAKFRWARVPEQS
ncbi:MAG: 16S rRNA (cytosine(1402)-N(4))-methyltransferase RsmH [Phycisphaerae bacterium]|nr:16S rRNA (cytosine(1402)-N(4))-methyltransferase RsmH [Phycisphaerae bacterium]NUQ47149.1 16S rRNA (cytosine(1402)-N(4))-methyltransferase RsmH [Phycisphaerae bacterium]